MNSPRWKPLDIADKAERDRRAMADMLAFVTPRVVAMAVEESGDVFSGFLVEAEERFFIVTAHHCIRDIDGYEGLHLLGVGRLQSDRPIGDEIINSGYATNEGETYGECDVAFLEIKGGLAGHLSEEGARWVPMDELDSSKAIAGHSALLVGFPQDRVRPHPTYPWLKVLRPTVYVAQVTEQDVSRMDRHDEMAGCFAPGMHILLDLPTVHSDMEGNPSDEEYSTDGVSGAGVFAFPGIEPDGTWSAEDSGVVGVYTGDFPKRELMFIHRSEMVYGSMFKYLSMFRPRRS